MKVTKSDNFDDGIAIAYYCKGVKDLSLVNYISIDLIENAEEIDTHTCFFFLRKCRFGFSLEVS